MSAVIQSRGYGNYVSAVLVTTLALGVTLSMRLVGEHKQLLLFLAAVVVCAAAGSGPRDRISTAMAIANTIVQ